jgi:hypothetical protein
MIDITQVYETCNDILHDEKFIQDIHNSMNAVNHTWRGETHPPNPTQIQNTLALLFTTLQSEIQKYPNNTRHSVGTGGLNVSFTQWPSGSQEINAYYTPNSKTRSIT